MFRQHPAWILMLFLPVLPVGAGTAGPFTESENITGKLVFYQRVGNATYVRDTELASAIPTETMFDFFDPNKNFSYGKFTYNWDLGNGQVFQGSEPFIHYLYPQPGNYTLRLKIGGKKGPKYSMPVEGVFSQDVQVLDAIKNIEMMGPSDYKVSQDTSLAFHIDGSPPMWVCWRFLANCIPDPTESCTLTMVYENTLQLNHTFTSAGFHCLDINIRNDISKLQTSFSLYVRRNNNTHLIFILTCAAILLATFSFIIVIACRPRHYKSQLPSSSNAIFMKNQDSEAQSRILFNVSNVGVGERDPLMLQHGTQYSS
ncbi:transmembrane protein 130 [Cololabis saira]|uniref:transmembrane protein 130 n=1 Tax=Cololabis saira TaxID=129043 RepID=UPI002AD45C7A|nr:transmembrane protein 130 [Cololabis saira]